MAEDPADGGELPPPRPEQDTLSPTVTIPPPPPLPEVEKKLRTPLAQSAAPPPGVRGSLAPLRRSLIPIRNSLVPLGNFVRRTLAPFKPWVPRWKPWSPQRALGVTLAFAAAMGLAVLIAPATVRGFFNRVMPSAIRQAVGTDLQLPLPAPPAERADAKFVRKGRSPVAGSLMTIPTSFESQDGAYDLVVHFHGNSDLVEDSFSIAKINAVVVIVNIGIGSGPYEDRFSNPDVFRELSSRVKGALEKRGLVNPVQRRVALTAWSAGYGAVVRIIENPTLADSIDAIILLDGIHASFMQNGIDIDPKRIAPFERFARKAIAGEKLFVITHSDIRPTEYAGTHDTTDAVLKAVGVTRTDGGTVPEMPALSSNHGVPKSKMLSLKPLTEANSGDFHVRGYSGESPEQHMAHLIQMASIALPDLAKHWASDSAGTPRTPGSAGTPRTPGRPALRP